MTKNPSRRTFVKTTAAIGAGYWAAGGVAPRESISAIERIQFGCIGVGGKGASDSEDANRAGDVVAITDIDEQTIAKEIKRFKSNPTVFYDFREMLEKMGDKIDAVTVSVPDHSHAVAAATAMKLGKACFCQKPLTRTIWEARRLGDIAKEKGVATQMGNQGSEKSGLREAAARIRGGFIGQPKEVHVWTNRPVWPQGIKRPEGEKPPAHVHWEQFIGPAQFREYSPAYHPFKWRGFWDFGTGALGDMACHTMNMPFAGCELVNPIAVKATTSGHNKETFPGWSVIEFDFAPTENRDAVKVFWYDGGKKPDANLLKGKWSNDSDTKEFTEIKNSGSLIIGEKGKIFSPDDYGAEYYWQTDSKPMDVEFERSPGHFREWVNAIKGGKPAWSNFPEYASKLTEVILLGNLAVWAAGESKGNDEPVSSDRLEWDQKNLKIKGTDAYDAMIKPTYRDGYEV
ncbi:MAG: Gfo/Idh/MocA family protein [Aureliella sp.]